MSYMSQSFRLVHVSMFYAHGSGVTAGSRVLREWTAERSRSAVRGHSGSVADLEEAGQCSGAEQMAEWQRRNNLPGVGGRPGSEADIFLKRPQGYYCELKVQRKRSVRSCSSSIYLIARSQDHGRANRSIATSCLSRQSEAIWARQYWQWRFRSDSTE